MRRVEVCGSSFVSALLWFEFGFEFGFEDDDEPVLLYDSRG